MDKMSLSIASSSTQDIDAKHMHVLTPSSSVDQRSNQMVLLMQGLIAMH
jgi:hypothetical protein